MSMATKRVAWSTGNGNITLTYDGQGDGPITVQSDQNDLATDRSQTIVIETAAGSPVVTKNLTINQGACPIPVGTVKNYGYTGAVQDVYLPAGRYKLQCWGAQGGSNAAASAYGITAKAGGKGGYSEGVITLTSPTTLKIYVGGAGSSSAGGFNGGGSTSGSASYSSGDTQGVSRMGGGGGATDIRLSDGALLSRMIVAGGGSGGAMCYRKVTTTSYSYQSVGTFTLKWDGDTSGPNTYYHNIETIDTTTFKSGKTYRIKSCTNNGPDGFIDMSIGKIVATTRYSNKNWKASKEVSVGEDFSVTFSASSGEYLALLIMFENVNKVSTWVEIYLEVEEKVSSTEEDTDHASLAGFAGGGITGAGYSSSYQGTPNSAGSNGSFGQGANQSTTNYRYCSGAGGGGWYGGGMNYSDSDMNACKMSGGGSGFVNTAANAGNRPSGYTGLELDSGSTVAGNTSFEAPGGGTETGHSGNGYARITRLS